MINYTPLEYIKIDIANQYGLDKQSFPQRLAWVNRVKDLHKYVDKADKPYQYMAAVQALEDAKASIPTGHMVGLDACSSGIAIMGICMGCKTTSTNTGVVGQKRKDMYTECHKEMNKHIVSDVPRNDVKAAQMTFYYGSAAEPKAIFGEGTDELTAFYQAQETVAPGAVWLMNELLNSWQPMALNHSWLMPDGFQVITPVLQKTKAKIEIDELNHASIQYVYEVNKGTKKGLSVAANAVHSIDAFIVRELVRRCMYNKTQLKKAAKILVSKLSHLVTPIRTKLPQAEQAWKDYGFISLAGIETITIKSVIQLSKDYCIELLCLINEVLNYPTFEIITIHDEFKCHPNHMNRLREIYVSIMAELAESNIMECIIQQIRNDPHYSIKKLSNNLGDHIRESEYFLS